MQISGASSLFIPRIPLEPKGQTPSQYRAALPPSLWGGTPDPPTASLRFAVLQHALPIGSSCNSEACEYASRDLRRRQIRRSILRHDNAPSGLPRRCASRVEP